MPLISIVVLSFNSKNFIAQCLDSIFNQTWRDFEIIVVDNGSKDGTLGFLKEKYPYVLVIENKANLGACKARNQGIEIAKGEWILTLDCDIVLTNDFLFEIDNRIKDISSDFGVIQPKILRAGTNRIYSSGIHVTALRRFHDIGKDDDAGKFKKEIDIFGACCAAAVYRKSMLEDVKDQHGYFDERFFFLFEDVDLSWRAQRKGWKALFVPETKCYHFSNSSTTPRKVRQYLCFRNRYLAMLKNDSIIGCVLPFIFYDLPRFLYLLITNPYALTAIKDIFRNRYINNEN